MSEIHENIFEPEHAKGISEDHFFQEDKRLQCEAVFASRKDKPDYVDYEFKLYKGQSAASYCGVISNSHISLFQIRRTALLRDPI